LSELVDAGLLERRPYREPGQRSREEYVLTDAGQDFMPVVWAMFEWGQRHLPRPTRLRLTHRDCGADATVTIRCADGHDVALDELAVGLGKKDSYPQANSQRLATGRRSGQSYGEPWQTPENTPYTGDSSRRSCPCRSTRRWPSTLKRGRRTCRTGSRTP